jgi:predicted Zn-dependent protease with MMP-like domain
VRVTRRRFEQLVADAFDTLPPHLLDDADNVAVLVEDEPTPEQRAGVGGHSLLGLYEGVPLTARGLPQLGLPDRITLFRFALCDISHDEADLAQHIRTTLVHEYAHHFGIDDDRLTELGWA